MIDSSIVKNIIFRLKKDFELDNISLGYFSLRQNVKSTNIVLQYGCLMDLKDLTSYVKFDNMHLKTIQDILKIVSFFKTCYGIMGIEEYQGIFNFIKIYIPFDNTQRLRYLIDHEINGVGMYYITDIPEIDPACVRFKESKIPKSYRKLLKGDCDYIIKEIESIFIDIYKEQADNTLFVEQEFFIKKILYT